MCLYLLYCLPLLSLQISNNLRFVVWNETNQQQSLNQGRKETKNK